MYVYQEGKLYRETENGIIGVSVYPDKIIEVEGTETEKIEGHEILTPYEMRCRFNVHIEPYVFKVKVKKDKKQKEIE
jgi:hypothetical protein